jgi:hypothetical protein
MLDYLFNVQRDFDFGDIFFDVVFEIGEVYGLSYSSGHFAMATVVVDYIVGLLERMYMLWRPPEVRLSGADLGCRGG